MGVSHLRQVTGLSSKARTQKFGEAVIQFLIGPSDHAKKLSILVVY
jgi:hypothetical protein